MLAVRVSGKEAQLRSLVKGEWSVNPPAFPSLLISVRVTLMENRASEISIDSAEGNFGLGEFPHIFQSTPVIRFLLYLCVSSVLGVREGLGRENGWFHFLALVLVRYNVSQGTSKLTGKPSILDLHLALSFWQLPLPVHVDPAHRLACDMEGAGFVSFPGAEPR